MSKFYRLDFIYEIRRFKWRFDLFSGQKPWKKRLKKAEIVLRGGIPRISADIPRISADIRGYPGFLGDVFSQYFSAHISEFYVRLKLQNVIVKLRKKCAVYFEKHLFCKKYFGKLFLEHQKAKNCILGKYPQDIRGYPRDIRGISAGILRISRISRFFGRRFFVVFFCTYF